jgi:release factor glutamine methyltransferase
MASDQSAPALQVARRNAARHGVAHRLRFVQGDLLEMTGGPLALVVSNPPYIATGERDSLMPEVRDHEPSGALFAGESGMEAIERIVARAARLVAPGGWLVLEIDCRRSAQVERLLSDSSIWQNAGVRPDYAGLPRVARARRAGGGN